MPKGNFDSAQHPRGADGRFISKQEIKDIKSLEKKSVEHWTKSGSKNPDKYKGLTKGQSATVDAFDAINDGRELNSISQEIASGKSFAEVSGGHSPEAMEKYRRVDNYMRVADKYEGHVTRLMRDDKGIFDMYNAGDTMTFDRLTSFGKEGNDFNIRGGNLTIHIERSTRGTSIEHLMQAKEEREILMPPGKYRVINKEPGHIYLEEI